MNRVLIRPYLNKTFYELWKDRKPNIGYFIVFACNCFILNIKDNLCKFNPKYDVIFSRYSNTNKAYSVYNKRTLVVEECIHVIFDEFNPSYTEKVVVNDDADEELQKEKFSNDKQDNALCENQEKRQERQTNIK